MVQEKYQWAIHIRSLPHDEIRSLIHALEGSIALNIEVQRYTAYVKFAKEVVEGK